MAKSLFPHSPSPPDSAKRGVIEALFAILSREWSGQQPSHRGVSERGSGATISLTGAY